MIDADGRRPAAALTFPAQGESRRISGTCLAISRTSPMTMPMGRRESPAIREEACFDAGAMKTAPPVRIKGEPFLTSEAV